MAEPTIHPTARLGERCSLGQNVVIEEDAQIGSGVLIGHNVVVHAGAIIGDKTQIGDNAILGQQPRPSPTSTVHIGEPLPACKIGQACRIGAGAIVYAGSTIGRESMVADQAFVREKCVIGDFVIIGRGVTVENNTAIGDYTKVQSGAYITAYMTIEDHVFIAPCVVTTNDNYMGRTQERFKHRKGATICHGARVGANAILLPGITIGREAFIAAGSVVTKDVPAGKLVMGVPARIVRDVPENEYVENQ